MEDHFPNVPGLQKISQSKARSMMGTIEARKPFVDLIRKVFFKRKKLTYSYEVEKNDGQGNEVRTEITRNGLFLMIHGVRAKTIDEQKVEIPSEPTNYSEGGTFQDLIDAIVKVKTKKIPEGNIGIKRPRGRPRLTEEELLIRSKAEAKKIKRSRGRPKKTIGPSYPTSKFTGQSNNFPRRAFSTLRDSGPLDFKSKSRIDKIKEIINYLCIKEELHPRKHPLTGDISKPPFSFPGATILSKRINYIYNKQQD